MEAAQYQIIDTIGTGRFSTVYRARDARIGRDVALKQVHHHLLADPESLEPYWEDVERLAGLESPHLAPIYEVVRARGWVAMELLRSSLEDRAGGEPLSPGDARAALVACLEALKVIHEAGMIHGDVRPGNLLWSVQHQVKLADFSLAGRARGDDGRPLPLPARYAAPEQLCDRFGPVGRAADLYGLGITLHELLCGQLPEMDGRITELAEEDREAAWAAWHTDADRSLPDPRSIRPDVPEDLARVIQRLAAKDPAVRYASAESALADLGPEPASDADEAEEAARAAAAAKERARRRLRLGALGLAAGTAVLCLGMWMAAWLWPGTMPWSGPSPRLSSEAQEALAQLAATLGEERVDGAALQRRYRTARELAAGEPAVEQLYALALVKHGPRSEALRRWEQWSRERPDLLLPREVLAWLDFEAGQYRRGVDKLTALVASIPRPGRPGSVYSPEAARVFVWAGQVREYLATVAPPGKRPPADCLSRLDAAVKAHAEAAQNLYRRGRNQTRDTLREFDRRIRSAETYAPQPRLRAARLELGRYVRFPFDEAAEELLADVP